MKYLLSAAAAALLLSGCVSGTYEVTNSSSSASGSKLVRSNTLALTKAEQWRLADEMTDAIMVAVQRGILFPNPSGKYVLGIGSLDNDTGGDIADLNSFEDRVKENLFNNLGLRVTINDNLRADGNVDEMQDALKEARGNADYDQSKVIKRGGLQTFTHVLRTRLKEESVPLNGGKVEITYELNMRINDAYTGTTMWTKTTSITKVGSRKDRKW